MTERDDVYEAWNYVKDLLKEGGAPCGWGRLRDAINVINEFVDELTERIDV